MTGLKQSNMRLEYEIREKLLLLPDEGKYWPHLFVDYSVLVSNRDS